jgi:uncharacterized iron-regulated membrane protein
VLLEYLPEKGLYTYQVTSMHPTDAPVDIRLYFDGDGGQFVSISFPMTDNFGLFITDWLRRLHMAQVWGLPYKLFVCLMGLVVAMLSATGVYIWWKKRRAVRFKRKAII